MRSGAVGLWVGLAVVVVAGSAAAQDDLFSVVRRGDERPVPTAATPERTKHFTLYRNATPAPAQAEGFGMYATSKGAAFDLTSVGERVEGPSGSLFSQSAGLGWRSRNMSAMVGYMKPSSVKSATHFEDEHTPVYRSRARFGLGWALHF